MSNRETWCLDPEIDFLNHGSFGATPRVVMEERVRQLELLERDPIRFLAPERELEPKLDAVRRVLASVVGADAADIAFVRNATDGVNAVVRSFPLAPGDEVVVTNHGYNACSNAVRFATKRAGAETRIAMVPFPISSSNQVLRSVEAELSPKTRLIVIDHVTSPTGLVFPVQGLIQLARQHNVRILIDGAHAPGMLPVDLRAIQPDYYTANHHKWLCAPKASGFLYVRPEWQSEVQPTIISHAYNGRRLDRSRYTAGFDWMGTHDPTPLLALASAIRFLQQRCGGELSDHMNWNRQLALASRELLCGALGLDPPCPDDMIGSLVSVPLKGLAPDEAEKLGKSLYDEDRIEVPIFSGVSSPGQKDSPPPCLRISLQAYNRIEQVEKLSEILARRLPSV